MATGTVTPTPYQTVLDANGNPVSGAKIYTYLAGTTTLVATYTEVTLTTANANPIIADASGRWTAFLSPGAAYKIVIQDSSGASIRTQDNVTAVPASSSNLDIPGVAGEALTAGLVVYLSDGSGSKAAGSWFTATTANTYSSTLPEIGMTTAAIASGATGTIRLSGQATGLSALTVGTTYYVTTAGGVTSTAPTNRRVVGVADSTSSLILTPNPYVPNIWPTITISNVGNVADLAISGLSGNTVIKCSGATDLHLTGIAGGVTGQILLFLPTSTGDVYFKSDDGSSSTVGNRFALAFAGGNELIITKSSTMPGLAGFVYSGTYWINFIHEQGTAVSYSPALAGAGSAIGNGTQSGYYIVRGREVFFELRVKLGSTSTIGTVASVDLPFAVGAATTPSFTAYLIDDSAGTVFLGVGLIDAINAFHLTLLANNGTAGGGLPAVISTVPFTWTTNDRIYVSGSYHIVE